MEEDPKEEEYDISDNVFKLETMRLAVQLVCAGAGENVVHIYRDMMSALKED